MTTTHATSDSHPIYVSWLPSDHSGRVGLTFAPGKKSMSKWSNIQWDRDLATDLYRLATEFEVALLVNLMQDHEYARYQIQDYEAEVARQGIRLRRLPIRDGGVLPAHQPVAKLVNEITAEVRTGHNVVIHCAGGLGRTGTVGGCWLVSQGMSADEAIKTLHQVRSPHCPETRGQEQFIRDFAKNSGVKAG